MVITLYYEVFSPPCHNVELTCKALGIEYVKKHVDLLKGEQKTPEYLALNSRGKVPCVVDGDYVIAESQAISTYLCNQYEKGDDSSRLYPTDPKARGLVDQLLYVSESTDEMIMSYVNVIGGIFKGERPREEKIGEVRKALDLYEGYLTKTKFIAGNHLTIADFYMVSPLFMLTLADYKITESHQKTLDWWNKIQRLPYFKECCDVGIATIHQMYKSKLGKA